MATHIKGEAFMVVAATQSSAGVVLFQDFGIFAKEIGQAKSCDPTA